MKKNLVMLGVLILLALGIYFFTDIKTVEEYYLIHAEDIGEDDETVTMSINCSTILDHWDKLDEQLKSEKYVPADGVILEPTKLVLREGDSAFDVLVRACRYHEIQMEFQGESKNIFGSQYIRGINHLYERSCGPLSGWMFRVNGEYPSVGCGMYDLKNNDIIEWVYTCELGKDVGNEYKEVSK